MREAGRLGLDRKEKGDARFSSSQSSSKEEGQISAVCLYPLPHQTG
jgi:hypothetical protein